MCLVAHVCVFKLAPTSDTVACTFAMEAWEDPFMYPFYVFFFFQLFLHIAKVKKKNSAVQVKAVVLFCSETFHLRGGEQKIYIFG